MEVYRIIDSSDLNDTEYVLNISWNIITVVTKLTLLTIGVQVVNVWVQPSHIELEQILL